MNWIRQWQHGFIASVFKSNRNLKYSSFEKREKSERMGKSQEIHRKRTNNNANPHIVEARFNDPLYDSPRYEER